MRHVPPPQHPPQPQATGNTGSQQPPPPRHFFPACINAAPLGPVNLEDLVLSEEHKTCSLIPLATQPTGLLDKIPPALNGSRHDNRSTRTGGSDPHIALGMI